MLDLLLFQIKCSYDEKLMRNLSLSPQRFSAHRWAEISEQDETLGVGSECLAFGRAIRNYWNCEGLKK